MRVFRYLNSATVAAVIAVTAGLFSASPAGAQGYAAADCNNPYYYQYCQQYYAWYQQYYDWYAQQSAPYGYGYDYLYPDYAYGVPVGVGLGFGFFHHRDGFHHGGFRGGGFRGGGFHGGGGHGGHR